MKSYCLYIILLIIVYPSNLMSQGLGFDRMGYIKGDTTSSLTIFEYSHPVCNTRLVIDFELAFDQVIHSGYILKISDKKDGDFVPISLVTSCLYDKGVSFVLNKEPVACLTSDTIPNERLGVNHWIKVRLELNLHKDSLKFNIGEDSFSFSDVGLCPKLNPDLRFGTSTFSEELPQFQIRNLRVACDDMQYDFPLDETSGSAVHTSKGEVVGKAIRPLWLIKNSYDWRKLYSHKASQIAYVNYYRNQFIFCHGDSVFKVNLRTLTTERYSMNNPCNIVPVLGVSVMAQQSAKLYAYELERYSGAKSAVAVFDLETQKWNNLNNQGISHQIHHHGCTFDESRGKFYIFGGFGSQSYFNKLYEIDITTGELRHIKLSGDVITPRFFTSMCTWKDGTVLIYGGTGNRDGAQSLGKVYYNDLYEVNTTTGVVKMLWDVSPTYSNQRLSPLRSMIVSDDSVSLYTMCYPVHEPESHLVLYEIDVKNGRMTERSSAIPMESKSILSNANLYYNRSNKTFYCYTQEYTPHGGLNSLTTIYTLNTPLISKELLSKYDNEKEGMPMYVLLLILAGVIGLLIGAVVVKRKKRAAGYLDDINRACATNLSCIKNSIYLFGVFSVFDRRGKDISYMFSSKLRQVFTYLLLCSIKNRDGVASQQLQSVLWPDKSHKSAKNLKGVFISKLRSVLEELDGIGITYDGNNYHIDMTDAVWCDYKTYFEGRQSHDADANALVNTLGRGKFLLSIDDDVFDDFRSDFEHDAIEFLLNTIEISFAQKRYSEVISECKVLLSIESTNEYGLWYQVNSYKITHNMDSAKQSYAVYTDEYIRLFGENPSLQYADLLSHSVNWIIERK